MPQNKYFVLKHEDLNKLTPWYLRMLRQISNRVERIRLEMGKPPQNDYVVINTDEPFIEEVVEIMQSNGFDVELEETTGASGRKTKVLTSKNRR